MLHLGRTKEGVREEVFLDANHLSTKPCTCTVHMHAYALYKHMHVLYQRAIVINIWDINVVRVCDIQWFINHSII